MQKNGTNRNGFLLVLIYNNKKCLRWATEFIHNWESYSWKFAKNSQKKWWLKVVQVMRQSDEFHSNAKTPNWSINFNDLGWRITLWFN